MVSLGIVPDVASSAMPVAKERYRPIAGRISLIRKVAVRPLCAAGRAEPDQRELSARF
jgi:hypothetical protein